MREAKRSGWNTSSASRALAGGDELDRQPGHLADGEHGPAAGVGVDLGDDDAGALDGVVEVAREGDRLLAGHRVDDDQHLGGVDLVGQLGQLVGELVVEGDRAAGVDHDGGGLQPRRLLERALRDLGRGRLLLLDVDRDVESARRGARSCSLAAARWKSVATSSGLRPSPRRCIAMRAASVVFPEPCTPTMRTVVGPLLGEQQRLLVPPEDLDQLLVDDADDLLAGRDRLQHLGPEGALADAGDEVADDLEVDVGLEQGDAHLAQRRVEVVLGDAAAAAEAAEGGLQTFAEGL